MMVPASAVLALSACAVLATPSVLLAV